MQGMRAKEAIKQHAVGSGIRRRKIIRRKKEVNRTEKQRF